MSLSRRTFYETINLMRGLSRNPLLTDSALAASVHNNQARILRNGLLISSFSLLEAYIEDRLEEKIQDLSESKMSYATFGDSLRTFLTLDAITGLNTRVSFAEKADRLAFAEAEILRAAASQSTPPRYTALGFSPKGSNIVPADIKTLLAAFGVKDGWGFLSKVCANLGASRISLQDDFQNFFRTRNRAAHVSTTNVASGDLETHLGTALLTGISVDIALSNAIDCFVEEETIAAAESSARDIPDKFRFVDEQLSGIFHERIGLTGNTIKKYPDRPSATREVVSRKKALLIVFRDARLVPTELM
jgi:hypothetical protein